MTKKQPLTNSTEPPPQQPSDTTRKLTPRAALTLQERLPSKVVPWLGILRILDHQQNIEFRVERGITLGRTHGDTTGFPHINLEPYDAQRKGVSRLHAMIRVRSSCLSVQDLGSTNGTYLNGYRLAPFTDVPLEHNDLLELGELGLRLTLAAEEPAAG